MAAENENKYDKGYRRILSHKRNFYDFVKNHIAVPWVDQLDAEYLEHVNAKFVTKDLKDKESDIIYKAKIENRDVVFYVLLELQSSRDFTMPFRLLVYMTELLRFLFANADKNLRKRKDFRLPVIVPIVLYNGRYKWSCVKSFKEYLKDYELFVPNTIDFTYILFNVNEPDEEELLNTPSLINLAMYADRKGKPELVLQRLIKVLKLGQKLTPEERVELKDWVFDVILKKINNATVNEKAISRVKKALEREEELDMTYAIERAFDDMERRGIRKGKREGKLEGKREGKLEVAEKMIIRGRSIEEIIEYTGLTSAEVDDLRTKVQLS